MTVWQWLLFAAFVAMLAAIAWSLWMGHDRGDDTP